MVLDGGLQLSIPNKLLVVPERYIDNDGAVQSNTTVAEVLIQPTLITTADTPLIGKMFWSQNYIYVDHDAGTFTVWLANVTTDSNLVTASPQCKSTSAGASAGSGAHITSTSSVTAAPTSITSGSAAPVSDASGNPGLSSGGIAGAVVGGVVATAAITAAAILCMMRSRKRRRRLNDEAGQNRDVLMDHYDASPSLSEEHRPKIESDALSVREMDAWRAPEELDSSQQRAEMAESRKSAHRSKHDVYELPGAT